MSDDFSGIDFALGVVRGARSFRVDNLGRLTGVHYRQVWRPGENVAECRKQESDWGRGFAELARAIYGTSPSIVSTPKPPATKHSLDSCKCGFYGYYDGSNDYYERGYVSAVVEGYGETIIGTRGFRASKSRIVALRIPKHVPERLAGLIARNYPGIPLFDKFSLMVAEFPPDANGQDVTPTSDPKFWERKA